MQSAWLQILLPHKQHFSRRRAHFMVVPRDGNSCFGAPHPLQTCSACNAPALSQGARRRCQQARRVVIKQIGSVPASPTSSYYSVPLFRPGSSWRRQEPPAWSPSPAVSLPSQLVLLHPTSHHVLPQAPLHQTHGLALCAGARTHTHGAPPSSPHALR